MTNDEMLNQIKEVKDRIDVCEEWIFDEGYYIGYLHGVYDGFDKILETVERLNHNGSISVKLLRKELKSLKENKQE